MNNHNPDPFKALNELRRRIRNSVWTASKVEEVIAALYGIAGFAAWGAGLYWIAWALFIKAALDTVCAIIAAIVEVTAKDADPNEPR